MLTEKEFYKTTSITPTRGHRTSSLYFLMEMKKQQQ